VKVKTLKVIVFPGGFNLPLWAGMHCGAFDRQDLEIGLHFTTDSMQQLAGLVRGEWEIGLTGFDNVVAYQEGQGEAALDREPDLFAFMGGDSAFLHLVVRPEIAGYADLRGRVLSVDALTTGFAFVLRKMLASNGISESDVQFERAGGVLQRFEALKEGKHAGTLLVTPFDLIAQRLGMRVLQSAFELLPHYQGVCGAARRAWAADNPDVLARFIRGYLAALDWLYDRGNADAACALLLEKVPNMSPEVASTTCRVFLAAHGGFDPKARLDIKGVETVLVLRSEYGRPQKLLTDPRKYDDMSYYRRALEPMR
jgi:ABC-type nitrate/sulfonate/bicarbonate transport system substrate-binding protein